MMLSQLFKMILLIFMLAVVTGMDDREVVIIEEVITHPDGRTETFRYKPGNRPEPIKIDAPQAYAPSIQKRPEVTQRELTEIEKLELYELERAFANGEITESEYNQKKRAIWRSTFVGGPLPEDDGLFTQSVRF